MLPHATKRLPQQIKLSEKVLRLEKKALQELQSLQSVILPKEGVDYLLKMESYYSLKRLMCKVKINQLFQRFQQKKHLDAALDEQMMDMMAYFEAVTLMLKRKKMSSALIFDLHTKIKHGKRGRNQPARAYRSYQNWIGEEGCKKEQAYFLPPDPRDVQELMAEWLGYWKKKSPHPLIHCSLLFAQFLIIHPFMDGNGRIARAMILFYFKEKQLLHQPLIGLSEFFSRHRINYFQQLYKVTIEGSFEEWMKFFLEGVIEAVAQVKKRLHRIDRVRTRLKRKGFSEKRTWKGICRGGAFMEKKGSSFQMIPSLTR